MKMKKNYLFMLMVAGLLSTSISALAQDEEATFSLSGSVDSYFHTAIGTEQDAPSTSFANLPGFSLGMVNLVGSYGGEKAGFVADLAFGPRGKEAVFGTFTGQGIVNQLNAYWKPSESVTLTLGQFNTFLGYEVISPTVNFNYSTSYMFSWGPFNHTGLKANFEFGSGMNLLVAVMNPTDMVEFNLVDTYTIGGQLGYSGDMGGAWLNVLVGDQTGSDDDINSLFQIDLTTGWNLSDAFYLGLNATMQSTSIEGADAATFSGVALYPQLTLSESSAIGFRGEYFMTNFLGVAAPDADGNESVIDLTLTFKQSIGNLTLMPELRVDLAGEETWTVKDSTSEFTKTLPTFSLAAVYSF